MKDWKPLTEQERREIFASDIIHYKDYARLRRLCPTAASKEICRIKEELGDKARPTHSGCIDVRDYMEYFGYTWDDIYRC